jgi:hypothetical protein
MSIYKNINKCSDIDIESRILLGNLDDSSEGLHIRKGVKKERNCEVRHYNKCIDEWMEDWDKYVGDYN